MEVYGAAGLTDRRQARDLLALAAREAWGWDTLPPTARGGRGKPYFPGRPGRSFNLSHSGPLALCALDDRPVGVDIQLVQVRRPGLLRRICAPEELAWLEGADTWSRFALLWALKECRVKYTGEGLTRSIPGIRVPLPRGEETLLPLEGLWFRIYRGEDWRAAVCGGNRPPADILWRPLPPAPEEKTSDSEISSLQIL